jgi:hypothetical protein
MEVLARQRQLSAYRHDGFWQPMDTLRDRTVLEELAAHGDAVLGVDFAPRIVRSGSATIPIVFGDLEDPELPGQIPLEGVEWIVATPRNTALHRALLHGLRRHGFRGRVAVDQFAAGRRGLPGRPQSQLTVGEGDLDVVLVHARKIDLEREAVLGALGVPLGAGRSRFPARGFSGLPGEDVGARLGEGVGFGIHDGSGMVWG